MSINWEQKYKSLIEAKIPDIQGGVFSPDGEVLYCNNPKITEAFAAKSGIINAIEKGARIFFAVDINGQSYNLSSGEKNFDDVAQLHPMNDSTGGGVVGVPKGFMIVAYNEEVFRSYYPLMQEVVAAIKTELPEE